jgi:glycosyltransferase involved in cell wall biosynthesis
MKVAIVHDFLMQMGGAEKVVDVLHDMFPDAPVYTSAYDPVAMPAYYRTWDIRTSFLQRMAFKKYTHRIALPLYPMAFESFDLSGYDLVISSSSAFAKGVITQPHTTHICYTHAPMRYAWTTRSYMQNERASSPLRAMLGPVLHYLRTWDALASTRVDTYVANSSAVAQRISKFYRRDCEIVYPPVDTDRFNIAPEIGDYYIIVSRFVPYKRLDLAVQAFTRLGRPLKVVGTGRQMKDLQEGAGENVEFLGHVDDVELPGLLARARAFLMPGEEDFGIAPVEANACGRPVIAYAAGGALDSQKDGLTGVLFDEQSVEGLCKAVLRADNILFNPIRIRAHAQRFDTCMFQQRMKQVIAAACGTENRPFQPEIHEPALMGVGN